MSDLDDFRRGFHDGWAGNERDKRSGITYQRAYKAGAEGRKRHLELHTTEVRK